MIEITNQKSIIVLEINQNFCREDTGIKKLEASAINNKGETKFHVIIKYETTENSTKGNLVNNKSVFNVVGLFTVVECISYIIWGGICMILEM